VASDSNRNSQLAAIAAQEMDSDGDDNACWSSSEILRLELFRTVSFVSAVILALALMIFTYAWDSKRDAEAIAETSADKSVICSIEGSPVEVDKAPMSSRQDHSNGGALAPQ